jgi:hypothetical protein
VRQGDDFRPLAREFAPTANDIVNLQNFRQWPSGPCEMIVLRVAPDRENAFDLRQNRKQFIMPSLTAFAARRQIALVGIVAWKTKTHRHDRDPRLIVERFARNAHPLPQTIAGGIVERRPADMHFDARRLAGDEQPGGRSQPQDGTWLLRERRATRRLNADTAGPDAPSQRREPGNRMSVRHILKPRHDF